jgi:hypothetical protein
MSLYWAKNRNMMPTMIRATAIATDAELPLLPAAIRFSPRNRKLWPTPPPCNDELIIAAVLLPFR